MNEIERTKKSAVPAVQANSGDEEAEDILREEQDQTDQIMKTGAITTTKGKHIIHCLTIVGQVEGHYILPPQNKTTKYEHVIPQLVAIQENPEIEGLLIILNTVGGDVEAGLAIAELVSGMKKPTVSLVLGGGHSIGVPLAVSAKVSFIAPSATMTVHPVRMNGLVLGVPQTLSYFDRMQERIIRFVEDNSSITGKDFRKLMMETGELVMDVGTVLDGQAAVDHGLIDHLGGLSDAIECLYSMIGEDKKEKKPAQKQRRGSTPKKQTKAANEVPVASPRAIAQMQTPKRPRGRPRKNAAAISNPAGAYSTARPVARGGAEETAWINQSEAAYSGQSDKIPHTTAPATNRIEAGGKSNKRGGGK